MEGAYREASVNLADLRFSMLSFAHSPETLIYASELDRQQRVSMAYDGVDDA